MPSLPEWRVPYRVLSAVRAVHINQHRPPAAPRGLAVVREGDVHPRPVLGRYCQLLVTYGNPQVGWKCNAGAGCVTCGGLCVTCVCCLCGL